MNCEQIQNDIALWVGHDLAAPESEAIRQHLTSCPDCRTHARRIQSAMGAITRATPEATYDATDSLWPSIAQRLPHRPRKAPAPAWRRWLPPVGITAVAAGLMVAVVALPQGNGVVPTDVVPRSTVLPGSSAFDAIREQAEPKAKEKLRNPISTPAYQTNGK
jgi:anti-sigma factor RsiW